MWRRRKRNNPGCRSGTGTCIRSWRLSECSPYRSEKEKQRRGINSNMLSQDRSLLSSAMGDNTGVKNVLG